MKYKLFLPLFAVFLFTFISATTTSLSAPQTSFNVNPGNSGQIIVSYSTTENQGNPGSNGVGLTGSPMFLSYTGGSIHYDANTTTNGTITINYQIPSNSSQGNVQNYITIDGTTLTITFNVQTQSQSSCQINPSLTSFTQQVQQGQTFALPQVTFSPSGCTVTFDSSHIFMEGGVVVGGIQKPVFISSMGQGFVNLNVDTTGLTSNTNYNSFLDVNTGNQTTKIPITIIVTGSSTPLTNLTNLPTCSLDNSEYSINSTGTLTCNNLVPGVTISVRPNPYIKGNLPSISATQEQWQFTPVYAGVTNITADFIYQGFPVGLSFNQEIKIKNTGNSVSGTSLVFLLYQNGVQTDTSSLKVGDLVFQLEDNSTNSLITNYQFYSGGVPINNSITLVAGQNYEIRGTSPGYADALLDFNVTTVPINLSLSPDQQTYFIGQQIGIATDVNATLYMDGVQISSPYLFTSLGNHVLTAVKDGYINASENITVVSPVTASIITPDVKSWSKNDDVTMQLSASGIWNVTFEKANGQTYDPAVNVSQGVGSQVAFHLSDYGRYNVYLSNTLVGSYILPQNDWFSNNWYWIVAVAIVLLLLWLIFKGKDEGKGESIEVGY